MKPANAEFSENVIPIHVARLELRGRRVAAIRISHRTTDTETTLCKIQTVSNRTADPIVLAPLDEIRRHSALHDKIFDQVPHLVVHERGDHSGLVAKAFPQAA